MKIMPTTNRRGFLTTLLAGFLVGPKAMAYGIDPALPGSETCSMWFMESTANGSSHWHRNVFLKARQLGHAPMCPQYWIKQTGAHVSELKEWPLEKP